MIINYRESAILNEILSIILTEIFRDYLRILR